LKKVDEIPKYIWGFNPEPHATFLGFIETCRCGCLGASSRASNSPASQAAILRLSLSVIWLITMAEVED
jgi:hypothetical protein